MIRIGPMVLLVCLIAAPAVSQVQQGFPGVPPPVPSPLALPQPRVVTPPPTVAPRPRSGTVNDRVIRCNLAFPNAAGFGHNPTDRDRFVRYCAN